jgi:hypothetical protein
MKPVTKRTREHERRLTLQRAFPLYFVDCSCERGCVVCAYTGLVSKATGQQRRERPD